MTAIGRIGKDLRRRQAVVGVLLAEGDDLGTISTPTATSQLLPVLQHVARLEGGNGGKEEAGVPASLVLDHAHHALVAVVKRIGHLIVADVVHVEGVELGGEVLGGRL